MGVYLYDEALLAKLRKWTSNTSMMVYGVEETRDLFSKVADTTNDSPIKLPILCLRRLGGYSVDQAGLGKRKLSFNGLTKDATELKSIYLNAIPISIDYQIDVYTRFLKEADEYARNLIFNIINYPRVQIDIPYNGLHMIHDSNIRLTSQINDTSDVPERFMKGQFSRMTFAINIDDAYLFDVAVKDNVTLNVAGLAYNGKNIEELRLE